MTSSSNTFPMREGPQSADGATGASRHGAAAENQDEFASAFSRMTSSVARPLFEHFARLAVRRGFAAIVREEVDAENNPCLLLKFIPERGGQLGAAPSRECVFALKGILAEKTVEHAACHDQSGGTNGLRTTRGGLQSINKAFLEAGLEEFLMCALEARRPG